MTRLLQVKLDSKVDDDSEVISQEISAYVAKLVEMQARYRAGEKIECPDDILEIIDDLDLQVITMRLAKTEDGSLYLLLGK